MSRKKKPRPGPKNLKLKLTTKNKIPITKIEAARRQLETAIKLWFHEQDPVSIHTLIMASHGILRVLNRARNGSPMIGEPSPGIKPEFTAEWRNYSLQHANFFKHSSRSEEGEIHYFPPSINQILIADAVEAYECLTNEARPLMVLFRWYLRVHVPEIFVDSPPEATTSLKDISKSQFFDQFMPIAAMSPEERLNEIAKLRAMLGKSL